MTPTAAELVSPVAAVRIRRYLQSENNSLT